MWVFVVDFVIDVFNFVLFKGMNILFVVRLIVWLLLLVVVIFWMILLILGVMFLGVILLLFWFLMGSWVFGWFDVVIELIICGGGEVDDFCFVDVIERE